MALFGRCALAAHTKSEFKFVWILGFFRSLRLAEKLNLKGLTFKLLSQYYNNKLSFNDLLDWECSAAIDIQSDCSKNTEKNP